MSRTSLLAAGVLTLLLSACITHPPETTTVERPEGPVPLSAQADTSTTYLVVDRHYDPDSGLFWDDVVADTTPCRLSRRRCEDLYSGKIEETILTVVPEGEAVGSYDYSEGDPTSPAAPANYQPDWTGMQTQVNRLRDRAFEASLNGNWNLANELDSQAFWLQYELDRLRWWGRYGWNGQH